MVSPELRALAEAATGAGELTGADVLCGRAEHPACGDEVELDVRLRDGRIAELRWRAHGCPATFAVAAAAAAVLPGVAPAAAPAALRRGLGARGDLAPAEGHAEALLCRALQAALASAKGAG